MGVLLIDRWQLRLAMLIATSIAMVHCYSPTIRTGLACSQSDECPNGQECFEGTCDVEAGTVDASGFTGIDANTAPDAMVDAALCPVGTQTFSVTGVIESFTVPDCVTMLTIEGLGAQGGGGRTDPSLGGKGARILGEFRVEGGALLQILVGQRGLDAKPASSPLTLQHAGGSGGGGSFVVDSSDVPLIVAGGGGGATDHSEAPTPGGPGQITTTAQGSPIALGGQNGLGGDSVLNPGGFHTGTGGGGFFGDGIRSSDGNTANYGAVNQPGIAFLNGGLGGLSGDFERDGGFGGGGAAGFTGGGGGGYSGGGGGGYQANLSGGGGGGSFNTGEKQENTTGVNTGDGVITLSW